MVGSPQSVSEGSKYPTAWAFSPWGSAMGGFKAKPGHGAPSSLTNLNSTNQFFPRDTLWRWGWGETDAPIHFWKECKLQMPLGWATWQYIPVGLPVYNLLFSSSPCKEIVWQRPRKWLDEPGAHLMMEKTGKHLNFPTVGAEYHSLSLPWKTNSHLKKEERCW